MSADITKWFKVSQCLSCQASAPSLKKPSELMPIKVVRPGQMREDISYTHATLYYVYHEVYVYNEVYGFYKKRK
ncbi:hypothetical protein ATANTOWER_021700 [Ataeniobius toweri]|uniref:Uncharacterized protein n=1 Tax=Ataeniobius toweri TaxID=208326 RepID=A0ABU7CC60_9TELE|nr:hypothetical protein [Ataeniobius toweri]